MADANHFGRCQYKEEGGVNHTDKAGKPYRVSSQQCTRTSNLPGSSRRCPRTKVVTVDLPLSRSSR